MEPQSPAKKTIDEKDTVDEIIDGVTGLVNMSMKMCARMVESSIVAAKSIYDDTSEFVKDELASEQKEKDTPEKE